ncbi:3'(2'),5'-bisphosphate nucleotidase CysQ [Bacteroidia bacterium]|nr:3'(2'),5'-bisphosphate nucleotidase CysQ [Bacteroidia bacterium]
MEKLIQTNIEHLIALVEQAGAVILGLYKKQDLKITMKQDFTPVTDADNASNEILTKGLRHIFPAIPIISEESNAPDYAIRREWEYLWLIDPLDGTKEFISRNGRFCINIALVHRTEPVFGLIYNILDKELIWTFKGSPCMLKQDGAVSPLPINLSKEPKFKMMVSRFNMTEQEFLYNDYLREKGFIIELIPMGASVKHTEVARGNADFFPKYGPCYEWDSAAGQVILESAGGFVLNPENRTPLTYNKEELKNPPFIMFGKRIADMPPTKKNFFIHNAEILHSGRK